MDLGFDDSYFDSTSGTKREGKKEEKGAYEARQCELQVRSKAKLLIKGCVSKVIVASSLMA